ncbi:MAG TPA: hypothetical protein VFV67_33225 [Actinophytocola sp.]|uniref:hypothetical protein n=1 Tax=Actinophytocola sp. TaxID=1872138 RepID=UPI002DBC06DF|nr:hypothetical protein [Actinophytocola sp.]HEU5475531.1 hypothetical protein [Actinophytocola sp.]
MPELSGAMTRVVVRGAGMASVVLGPGERLLFGRAPQFAREAGRTALALPDCAPHVSRLVGELVVDGDTVTLNWLGSGEAQLSGLFDAPGGARRVILTRSMSALLDDGESQLVLLLGRRTGDGLADLVISIDVQRDRADAPAGPDTPDGGDATAEGPRLTRGSREWFVALALTEPWLDGRDDYPRPPSNREIFERVRYWNGYTWSLDRSQRVDDVIRTISSIAFGPRDDPYLAQHAGRLQNIRFAVARRAAELRLVTAKDLAEVERAARDRDQNS